MTNKIIFIEGVSGVGKTTLASLMCEKLRSVGYDVAERLISARECRNQSVPTAEQIAFWENRKRIDLYALANLPIKTHILNVDVGWQTITETMTKCAAL